MTFLNPKHIKVIRSVREYNQAADQHQYVVMAQMDNNDTYKVVFPEKDDEEAAKKNVESLMQALLNFDLNRPLVKISDE